MTRTKNPTVTADLSVLLDQLKERPQIRGPVVIVALAEVAQAAEDEHECMTIPCRICSALARLGRTLAGEETEKVTHGRHCTCSACGREDWTRPELAPCGMHGSKCPPVYAPLGYAGAVGAMTYDKLIAEARKAWPRMTCARGSKMWHYNRVIDALEEAAQQDEEIMAYAERCVGETKAAEDALKVATDALEKIADFPVDVQSGNSNFKSGLARAALAAIRQNTTKEEV